MSISMMMYRISLVSALIFSMLGCTGMQPFTTAARPGETVALGLGWRHDLTRDNLTVTITAADTTEFIYSPGDPAIRAVINNYSDPISNMRVGYETGQNIVGFEQNWGLLIQGNITNYDRDWSQKIVLLDLPSTIVQGTASVDVSIALDGGGIEAILPMNIEILGGVGTSIANPFINWDGFAVSAGALQAMERANHKTITFSGSTLPYAIQLDLTHDPDLDSNPPGVGRAYVANAGGDVKNVHWTDDGENMRVILTPTRDQSITGWKDFKFYVAGEIAGLAVVSTSVQAFDINGVSILDMDTPTVQ
jgi:hypothetical protein